MFLLPVRCFDVCDKRTRTIPSKSQRQQGARRRRRQRNHADLAHHVAMPHPAPPAVGSGDDRERGELRVFGHGCPPFVRILNAYNRGLFPRASSCALFEREGKDLSKRKRRAVVTGATLHSYDAR
jgi:hypothetical protein